MLAHTSELLTWNSAKSEPSSISSKPEGFTPAALSFMNICTISTPSTSLPSSCMRLTFDERPSLRYCSAISRIVSGL